MNCCLLSLWTTPEEEWISYTGFIYNKVGANAVYGNETHNFFPNRTIKLSLGLNDRMTFWSLEGKRIPFINKSKTIPHQEGLSSLPWIVPAHKPLQAPS